VPAVLGVPVSVVDVVHMPAVHDGGVSAPLTVLVRVTAVRDVLAGLAFVPVSGVLPVEVAVVRVVDMVAVRDLGVAARGAVGVLVPWVLLVENGHGAHLGGIRDVLSLPRLVVEALPVRFAAACRAARLGRSAPACACAGQTGGFGV
jgi:hypothetical protein